MENKKFKVLRFLILFAISLSFVFTQGILPCYVSDQQVGPVLKQGKLYGLKIYGFRKDNVIRYAGFRKNDIILEVNGLKVSKLIGQGNLSQFSL